MNTSSSDGRETLTEKLLVYALGRGLTPEDGKPGAPPVFVMSYKIWQDRFNLDPSILALKGERHVSRFIEAIARASRPLVAAVQGRAVGIGTTMLLHCDFVVLTEDAQLSTPFVNLALVPEAASSLLMPLRIGYARAYEMFALGDTVDANTALALGLANRVVPLARLQDEANAVARRRGFRGFRRIARRRWCLRYAPAADPCRRSRLPAPAIRR